MVWLLLKWHQLSNKLSNYVSVNNKCVSCNFSFETAETCFLHGLVFNQRIVLVPSYLFCTFFSIISLGHPLRPPYRSKRDSSNCEYAIKSGCILPRLEGKMPWRAHLFTLFIHSKLRNREAEKYPVNFLPQTCDCTTKNAKWLKAFLCFRYPCVMYHRTFASIQLYAIRCSYVADEFNFCVLPIQICSLSS